MTDPVDEQTEARADGTADWRPNGPIVQAIDVSRRYGEGDAAVDALRDVSVDFERDRFTAIMGPSGSGQVDAHAHPRRARPADLGHGR